MAIAGGTAAAISAAVALAGAALGAAGAVRQEAARKSQARYQSQLAARNAQLAEQNARTAEEEARQNRREGHEAATRKRQEAALLAGSQRAEAGASGAQTDAGATLDRTLDTVEKGELDALSLKQQGEDMAYNQALRAWGYRNQAQASALDALYKNAQARTDYLGLGSTLLNGAARNGKNFYRLGSQGPRVS
ncbi:MAG: hypothetical protein Q4F27_03030 [Desulfovibrionaceae bacterium]|nr:hypothetical protein [Desulfovibrionaceae bacterium]